MLILLLLWPLLELFVIVKVAEAIGTLDTVVLLLVASPLGIWALRSQGAAVWRRMTQAVAGGQAPARHVLDGGLVVAGGALLILPGFITDVLGALLLVPASRALARRLIVRNFESRLLARAVRAVPFTRQAEGVYDVDSTAVDVDPRHLRQ